MSAVDSPSPKNHRGNPTKSDAKPCNTHQQATNPPTKAHHMWPVISCPLNPPQKNTHVDQSHKATAKPAKPPLLTSQVTSSASRLSRLGDGCATFRARSTGTVCATPRLAHELQRLVTPSHLSRHRGRGDVRRREVNGLTCVV